MRSWICLISGIAGLLFYAVAQAAVPSTKPVDVRDLMTVTQFDQAGLNKLTPQELKALNSWLNQYIHTRHKTVPAATSIRQPAPMPVSPKPSVATPVPVSSAANFGADTMPHRKSAGEPTRIESRMLGLFTGWTGNTVFKLENGQVWQQAASGYFTNVHLNRPLVVIKKLAFGYLLTLPGHGETVFVRRLK